MVMIISTRGRHNGEALGTVARHHSDEVVSGRDIKQFREDQQRRKKAEAKRAAKAAKKRPSRIANMSQPGERNGNSKITDAQKADLVARLLAGEPISKVRTDYGLSYAYCWVLRSKAEKV